MSSDLCIFFSTTSINDGSFFIICCIIFIVIFRCCSMISDTNKGVESSDFGPLYTVTTAKYFTTCYVSFTICSLIISFIFST